MVESAEHREALAIWGTLTEAERVTLMSVRVEGALTIWRAGAHKKTIQALREYALMAWPCSGGGLTGRGERVQAIGHARGYTQVRPDRNATVSVEINSFKANTPRAPKRRAAKVTKAKAKKAKRGKRG